MPSQNEIERRYKNIRAAMEAEKVDALIVCGNQYAGFEGAVRYVSDFEIVHRYVYVLVPLSGDPVLVFPREARWIGDKKAPFVREKVWAEIPGKWLREEIEKRGWKRVAVYGLDFVMAVRDYRELQGHSFELVPFDFHFDMSRAVKSEEELEGFRDSMDIILDGFHALLRARRGSPHDEHRLERYKRGGGSIFQGSFAPQSRLRRLAPLFAGSHRRRRLLD